MIEIQPYPGNIIAKSLQHCYHFLKPRSLNNKKYFKYLDLDFSYNDTIFGKESERNVSYDVLNKASPFLINNIFKPINNSCIVGIYVHGSWADNTNTFFSDLDDLVIIDRAFLSHPSKKQIEKWLNNVDIKFCQLDPLQHHGHWIIYKDQLTDYDESILPLVVLNNANRICGTTRVSAVVNIIKTKIGLLNNIMFTSRNIKSYHKKYEEGKINIFEMKCLIGSIFLVPAYLFQIFGKRITKKEAIERSREIFGEESQNLLNLATEIRSNWHLLFNNFGYNFLSFSTKYFSNPHLYRIFARKFSPFFPLAKYPKISSDSVKSFISDTCQALKNETTI